MTTRRKWTEREMVIVKSSYGSCQAAEIAVKVRRSVRAVQQMAVKCGVAKCWGPHGSRYGEDFQSLLREKNALGWSDTEIAELTGRKRHRIAAVRRRLGLPDNSKSDRVIAKISRAAAAQAKRHGVANIGALRGKVLAERSEAYGWPAGIRWTGVRILNLLWERGPMTRRAISDALGMTWRGSRASLKSNDQEGSYLANLVARELVVCLNRAVKGRGRGHSVSLYSVSPLVVRGPIDPELIKEETHVARA